MITVDRKQFSRAIGLAAMAVHRHNTIPVLCQLRVTANGHLSLEGSNLDTTTLVELPCSGKSGGSFCLPEPNAMHRAIGHVGGETLRIGIPARGGESFAIETDDFHLKANGLAGDDHPGAFRIGREDFTASLGADAIARIARIMPAISTEQTRYYLNGICVTKIGDWTWRFAATDGHKLMFVDIPLPDATGELPDKLILPREWIRLVTDSFRNTKDGAALVYGREDLRNEPGQTLDLEKLGGPHVTIRGKVGDLGLTLGSKLIDGTYPDYMRVVPDAPPHTATVSRGALMGALQALTPLGEGKTRPVSLAFRPGAMLVGLKSVNLGTAQKTIPAEHDAPDGLTVGFNSFYLLGVLRSIVGEEVQIGLTDPAAPTVFTDPADTGFKAILMPMRI